MLHRGTVRPSAFGGVVGGLAAGVATMLLLLVVNAVAGPGECVTEAVCRAPFDEPMGCIPTPPCDGPGPSLQTAVVVALLVGLVAGLAGVRRGRGRRG